MKCDKILKQISNSSWNVNVHDIILPIDALRIKVEHIFIQTILTGSFEQLISICVQKTAKPKPLIKNGTLAERRRSEGMLYIMQKL